MFCMWVWVGGCGEGLCMLCFVCFWDGCVCEREGERGPELEAPDPDVAAMRAAPMYPSIHMHRHVVVTSCIAALICHVVTPHPPS